MLSLCDFRNDKVQRESALRNIGSSVGLVNRCKHFSLASMELAALNQKDLRARARSTPGMTDKKKTADGKWIPKSKQELLAELEACMAEAVVTVGCPALEAAPGYASAGGASAEACTTEAVTSANNASSSKSCPSAAPCVPEGSPTSMELAALNQKDLRARACSTPGMTDKKKTADGKWIPKSKQELLAEFELLAEQELLGGMAALTIGCPALEAAPGNAGADGASAEACTMEAVTSSNLASSSKDCPRAALCVQDGFPTVLQLEQAVGDAFRKLAKPLVRLGVAMCVKKKIGKWKRRGRVDIVADYKRKLADGSVISPPGSASDRKIAQRDRQRSEMYKSKRLKRLWRPGVRTKKKEKERNPAAKLVRVKRLWRPGVRAAKRAAQTTEEYRARKREREAATRIRRKQLQFWRPCFRRWEAVRRSVLDAVQSARSLEHAAYARTLLKLASDQPYAPFCLNDGSLVVLQHGDILERLPRTHLMQKSVWKSVGAKRCGKDIMERLPMSEKDVEECRRAMSLRCRLGLQCDGIRGCHFKACKRHRRFVITYGYECSMRGYGGNRMPTPYQHMARVLCNSKCPATCCTMACPWRVVGNEFLPAKLEPDEYPSQAAIQVHSSSKHAVGDSRGMEGLIPGGWMAWATWNGVLGAPACCLPAACLLPACSCLLLPAACLLPACSCLLLPFACLPAIHLGKASLV